MYIVLPILFAVSALSLLKVSKRAAPRELLCKTSLADFLGILCACVFFFLIGNAIASVLSKNFLGRITEAELGFLGGVLIYLLWLVGILLPKEFVKNYPQFFLEKGFFRGSAQLLKGAGLLVLSIPILSFVVLVWQTILLKMGIDAPKQSVIEMFGEIETKWVLIVALVDVVVLAPLVEELLFRGIIYPFLKAKAGAIFSALATSILFSAIHLNWYAAVPIFALSLLLIFFYEKFGDLRVSMGAHAMFNLISALTILLNSEGAA